MRKSLEMYELQLRGPLSRNPPPLFKRNHTIVVLVHPVEECLRLFRDDRDAGTVQGLDQLVLVDVAILVDIDGVEYPPELAVGGLVEVLELCHGQPHYPTFSSWSAVLKFSLTLKLNPSILGGIDNRKQILDQVVGILERCPSR